MSTKIYDGLLIKTKSLFKLKETFKRVAEQSDIALAIDDFILFISLKLIERFVVNKDNSVSITGATKKALDDEIYEDCSDEPRAIKKQKFLSQYQSQLCITEIKNGKILGILFGRNATKAALLQTGIVEEYGYWDSVDKPDNVTGRQWSQRKRDWNNALTLGIPAREMFCIEGADVTQLLYFAYWKVTWLERFVEGLKRKFTVKTVKMILLNKLCDKIAARQWRQRKKINPDAQFSLSNFMRMRVLIQEQYSDKFNARAEKLFKEFEDNGGVEKLFEEWHIFIEKQRKTENNG